MAHKTKKKKKKLPSILNHLFQVDIDGNDLGSFFILVVCHFTVPQIISLRGLWRYRKKKKAKQKQNKQTKKKTANNSAFLSAKILNVSLQIITQGACLLVIRQNGKSQNRCYKKTKHAKFSKKKRTFFISWYAHARVRFRGVRNVRLSENLACCFLVTLILRLALLPFYQQTGPSRLLQ